ncbi:hypothetical protein [Streptomyces calidiresistens]|uniref:Uncharacterized protein n=1 Tax=Streptomyces calidiresistens TaxID=1485586 RepID=A0A7W3XUZ1_9ACTN|nr:hypothetical protein [Streptomyces calidiresistens]MBB0228187.1 hypothetical protein [Streptomyces calidiresistens]
MTGGSAATPPQEMERLRRYLEAMVAARGCPVHTAVAFNAAYFGYELDGEGYGKGPFDIDAFPSLTLGDEVPALPVGALVRIRTGADPLYAEILYKEGHHPRVEDADVPAWVSGAPPGARGPEDSPGASHPVRRELLVPDLTAFGPTLQPDEARLKRFRTRGRWLNEDGHVIVDARYASAQEAAFDDMEAFLQHLLTHRRESLLSPHVPVSVAHLVEDGSEEGLRAALVGLLEVVDHALRTGESLRRWGHYVLTRRCIGRALSGDAPLGGSDLRALVCSLERGAAPPTRRRHGVNGSRTVYTAVGPWLRGVEGAGPLLTGMEYAVSVCRANLAVTDFIRRDTNHGLRVKSDTRITLDDDFESGGIWRSHHPGSEEPEPGDPLHAAGRGWRSVVDPPSDATRPPTVVEEEKVAEASLVDLPLRDDAALGRSTDLRIGDSEIRWKIPLRLAHLMEDRLPLRPLVREELLHTGVESFSARLELEHPGGDLDEVEAVQEVTLDLKPESGMLRGVRWPIDFFPGINLHAQWPRGGRVLRLHTVELEVPVEIDGKPVSHDYDASVLLREGAPGTDRDGDSSVGLDTRQLVLRAVRRFGRLTPTGHALLVRTTLARAIYDTRPAPHQILALDRALDELLAEGHLYAATGSIDTNGEPHHPGRPGEPGVALIGYAPRAVEKPRSAPGFGIPPQSTGAEHTVHGFLRRLPPGSEPSDAQRAAYRKHCRRVGKADGWELPRGYTFVEEHSRRR